MKYVKVMNDTTSNADNTLKYKTNEINIAKNWNKTATTPEEMGGFNFSTEDKILRWLLRGDTLYEVTLPDDAEVVECESQSAPHGVFRANKIIIKNPVKITDEVAMDLYKKSDLHKKTSYQILEDQITPDNAKESLDIYDNFLKIRIDPMPQLYLEIKKQIENQISGKEE